MTDEPRIDPDTMLKEAASLFQLIGGMGAKHLVLVGGLVPPLLVPTPAESHIGSADIDVCLSVAFTGGATREYYKSIETKIREYFEPVDGTSFRWRKRPDAPGACVRSRSRPARSWISMRKFASSRSTMSTARAVRS